MAITERGHITVREFEEKDAEGLARLFDLPGFKHRGAEDLRRWATVNSPAATPMTWSWVSNHLSPPSAADYLMVPSGCSGFPCCTSPYVS